MFTRMVRGSAAFDAVYASGIASLVSGIGLLLAANFAISSFKSAQNITVDLNSFNWLKDAKVGTLKAGSNEKLNAALGADQQYSPLPQRKLAEKVLARRIIEKRSQMIARVRALAPEKLVKRDQIQITQAAPSVIASAAQEVTEAPKLESIHAILRSRFIAVVMDAAPIRMLTIAPKVNTQPVKVAKKATTQVKEILKTETKTLSVQKIEPQVNEVEAEKPAIDSTAVLLGTLQKQDTGELNRTIEAISRRVLSYAETKSADVNSESDLMAVNTQISRPLDIQKQAVTETAGTKASEERQSTVRANGPPATVYTQKTAPTAQPPVAPIAPAAAPAITVEKSQDKVVTTQAAPVIAAAKIDYSVKPEYSAPRLIGNRAWYIKTEDNVATQPQPPTEPTPPAPKPDNRFGTYKVEPAALEMAKQGCYEAFNWSAEIPFCDQRILTREVSGTSSPASWALAQAKEHWPTLYWNMNRRTVPVISKNTTLLLSRIADTKIQSEAGIVFGKLAPGWRISISGRADQPIILNSKNELVGATGVDSESYFAFLNAEPGATLVYFKNAITGASGSVAIPVLNGSATFVDLSRISFYRVTGSVFSAESHRSKGLRGITVSVIDQPQSAITDSDGAFEIEKVAVVDEMPVYVQTAVKDQYPHRYRLVSRNFRNAALFRFSENSIDTMIGQIEGGVSSESALVIGAIPQLVAQSGSSGLTASVRALLDTPILVPESYSIAPNGELRVQTRNPLAGETTRFISVQVPSGPVIAGVKLESNVTLWSELLLTSPRVISVVGPY